MTLLAYLSYIDLISYWSHNDNEGWLKKLPSLLYEFLHEGKNPRIGHRKSQNGLPQLPKTLKIT